MLMRPNTFQIRECLNPACRLRYPLVADAVFGDRCPSCLAETVVAIEQPLEPADVAVAATAPHHVFEALLDNVRSAMNVGSVFRTAEGLGFRHLYLAGITPTPKVPGVRKAALGAENSLAWSQHNNALELTVSLRARGHQIWVLENLLGAEPLNRHVTFRASTVPVVLVAGNERTGVDPAIVEAADRVICVPTLGRKSSLNAAVAFAIAAYALIFD